jgi:hypothetical protein
MNSIKAHVLLIIVKLLFGDDAVSAAGGSERIGPLLKRDV